MVWCFFPQFSYTKFCIQGEPLIDHVLFHFALILITLWRLLIWSSIDSSVRAAPCTVGTLVYIICTIYVCLKVPKHCFSLKLPRMYTQNFSFICFFALQIQEHLQMLQHQYDDSVAQRESLRERKVLTTLRLKRASVLITALADEKVIKTFYNKVTFYIFSANYKVLVQKPPSSLLVRYWNRLPLLNSKMDILFKF